VVEAALWNDAGVATLTQTTDASTSATLIAPGNEGTCRFSVATVRLDQLSLTGKRILLKLDLQGAEAVALEGLGEKWNQVEALILEVTYGPCGSYELLAERLSRRGFVEAATLNELEVGGLGVEADKLWISARRFASTPSAGSVKAMELSLGATQHSQRVARRGVDEVAGSRESLRAE
jgi:hypothetical protein